MIVKPNGTDIVDPIENLSNQLRQNRFDFIPVFGSGITAGLTGCCSSFELVKLMALQIGIEDFDTEAFKEKFVDAFSELVEMHSAVYAGGDPEQRAYEALKESFNSMAYSGINDPESNARSVISRFSRLLPYMCAGSGKCIFMSLPLALTCADINELLSVNEFSHSADFVAVDSDIQAAKEKLSSNRDKVYFQILLPLRSTDPKSICMPLAETQEFFKAYFGDLSKKESGGKRLSFLLVGMSEEEKNYFQKTTGVEDNACREISLRFPADKEETEADLGADINQKVVRELILTCPRDTSGDEFLNLLEQVYKDYVHHSKPGLTDDGRVMINGSNSYFGISRDSGDCDCEYREESLNSVYVSDFALSGSSSTSYINVLTGHNAKGDYAVFADDFLFSDKKIITEMVYGEKGLGKSRLAYNLFESICKDSSPRGQWSVFYFGCPKKVRVSSIGFPVLSNNKPRVARKALIVIDNIPICSDREEPSCYSPLYIDDYTGESVWVGLESIKADLEKRASLDSDAIIRILLVLNDAPKKPDRLKNVAGNSWVTSTIGNSFSIPNDFWTEEKLIANAEDYIKNVLGDSVLSIRIGEDVKKEINNKNLSLPGSVLKFISGMFHPPVDRVSLEETLKQRDLNFGLLDRLNIIYPSELLSEKIIRSNYRLPIAGREFDLLISHEADALTLEGNEYRAPYYDYDFFKNKN